MKGYEVPKKGKKRFSEDTKPAIRRRNDSRMHSHMSLEHELIYNIPLPQHLFLRLRKKEKPAVNNGIDFCDGLRRQPVRRIGRAGGEG